MVNPRKALLVAALAIVSMSSCDNSPVEPTSVTPVDVTITVLDFHSGNSALLSLIHISEPTRPY